MYPLVGLPAEYGLYPPLTGGALAAPAPDERGTPPDTGGGGTAALRFLSNSFSTCPYFACNSLSLLEEWKPSGL